MQSECGEQNIGAEHFVLALSPSLVARVPNDCLEELALYINRRALTVTQTLPSAL